MKKEWEKNFPNRFFSKYIHTNISTIFPKYWNKKYTYAFLKFKELKLLDCASKIKVIQLYMKENSFLKIFSVLFEINAMFRGNLCSLCNKCILKYLKIGLTFRFLCF